MGLRAILGQQVTVKGATTIAARFVEAFGDQIVTPFAELNRLTPAPARVAAATVDAVARLGIVSARANSILALAKVHDSGLLSLEGGAPRTPGDAIKALVRLPGIGPWTAQYIAMRALRWPDAFPKEDIAVRSRLGNVSASQAEALSQHWRPWRSYAVMHLWAMEDPAAHVQRGVSAEPGRRAPRGSLPAVRNN
jgi:AraC family transcriptional regulator of adaptative response / DNA-3-methyladenine glycosylase II